MIRLAVTGAAGRMGTRIVELATSDDQFEVVAALEAPGHPRIGESISKGVKIVDKPEVDFDVMIDFTLPDATAGFLEMVEKAGKPIVVGTTGHNADQLARISQAAKKVPVVRAANMSVGVNLLLQVAAQVAKVLGPDYDIEIVEAHHRFKKDAPSGTALALAESICKAINKDPSETLVHGRQGREALRKPGEVGMHALRLGDTVGEHEVSFGTLGETISLKHSAHTRDTFVKGALRAAAWLAGKPAGLYSMQDVLFGG